MSRAPFSQKRAYEILGVKPDASRDERARMFDRKKTLLERKLNLAMTPRLKSRYQSALKDLTIAYEALELDATEWDLESLETVSQDHPNEGSPPAAGEAVPGLSGLSPWGASPTPWVKRLLISAGIAAGVLGLIIVGGSVKTRTDGRVEARRIAIEVAAHLERQKAEEQTRKDLAQKQILAEQEAEALVLQQRQDAERKLEVERQVRIQLAEQQERLRVQPLLEEIDEALKKQRAAARNAVAGGGWLQEWTKRRLALLESYEAWLKSFTAQHPARAHLQAAERLFQSKDPDGALVEIQLAAEHAEKLRSEPGERRFAMVGKPLIDWLSRSDGEWPEAALTTLRSEEAVAVARELTTLKEQLAYLDAVGAKAVDSDWRDKLVPYRALAGSADAAFLRWQQRFIGAVKIESVPSGAALVDENGIAMGTTPARFELMRGGSLSLTAFRKGHTPTSLTATVGLGDEQVVTIDLPEIPTPRAGQGYTVPGLGLGLVWISPGTFTMGSPASEPHRASDEGPQVKVTLPDGFWLGKYEVTQGEWISLMSNNPSQFKTIGLNGPVETVSWRDAVEFCHRLTERERAAERLPAGYVYTLPTEAQWEYACRAGSTTAYAGGLEAMGWYSEDNEDMSHVVGQKEANAWGLYDMHGNVWEWCLDWYAGTFQVNTRGEVISPEKGAYRVSRGGSWNCPAGNCRSALRRWLSPADRGNRLGFRMALTRVKP